MKRFLLMFFVVVALWCNAAQTTPQNVRCDAQSPVVVTAPDTVITKTAYTFTLQGITISVSNGSAYPAGHSWNNLDSTYFACLANGSMTISATDTIRGIAINGWVKKNFNASADRGVIDYISDEYEDAFGYPVLTITDIDSTAVTIDCANQLRCFSIAVYFGSNPGSVQGEVMDTVRFTAVQAEALDYSDDTTFSAPGAYSYWLMLQPATVYPTVWLDLYAAQQGDLTGSYATYNFNVGDYTYVQLSADSWNYEYAYYQEFTITRNGNTYHVEGSIIADNDVQYEFVYDGQIALTPDNQEGTAIEMLHTDETQPHAVKRLVNGQLLIEKNGKIYTVSGTEVMNKK